MNIFTEGKTLEVSWFYFKNVGDQVQGTYVSKVTGLKDSFGNEQIIYELLTKTGIVKIGFRVPQKINKTMDYINFGQIVGFKYMADGKFKQKATGKEMSYKDIQVFADPKIVDQEWIDSHKTGKIEAVKKAGPGDEGPEITADEVPGFEGEETGFGDFDNPVPVAEETPKKKKTSAELLVEIADLAKSKLGVIDPAKVKDAVMEATSLAFIAVNYSKIIAALKEIE